jgi:DNA-directed RNA polymerase subunit RPC12/RpoP
MGAYQVLRSSNKKYRYDCADCGHKLEMIVKNVASGQWCNYCNLEGLCESEDYLFCFHKSFHSHPMAESWSDRNEIAARNILPGSNQRSWFKCKTCNHLFDAVLYGVSRGTTCAYYKQSFFIFGPLR